MMGKIKEGFEREFQALPQGVDAVEVNVGQNHSFEVDICNGQIETYDISHTDAVSIRVDCGEIGATYTELLEDDPKRLIALAAENASVVQTTDAKYMRFFEGSDHYESIPSIDSRLTQTTPQEKIELAKEIEQKMLAKSPLITRVEHAIVSSSIGDSTLFNSLGLSVSRQDAYIMAYAVPIAEKNGEMKNGVGYYIARSLEELDIDYLLDYALEDVLSQFDAISVASGTYDVVIRNTAMHSILQVFVSMFSADAAQKGLSLLAGKEGETIASKAVSLIDDPMNLKFLTQMPFDSEGVATYKKNVVEQGVLKTLLHNRKTAAKAGVQTTGNAAGIGTIGVGPSHFVLQEGDQSLEQLCRTLGNGLCITDVSGLHAGANAVTGDFSLLCRGFQVVNGERGQSVEQITIAGNFLDFLQRIQVVGNDTRFPIITTPSVLVQGIQVAGK